jgi:membrane fusion protein, heavy metal efflux system
MKRILFWLALIMLAGCRHAPETEHAHDSPEVSLSHTLYSEYTELFVEFKPLVAGVNTKFATHLTILGKEFKPLTKGVVTVSLIMNNEGIRYTASAPSVPGIYRLSLQPARAGKGDLVFDIKTEDFTDRHIIKDVMVYSDEKSAMSAADSNSIESNEITYLKEQAWKVEFANAPASRTPFAEIIRTAGRIVSAPGDDITIPAKANGIVKFSGAPLLIGNEVKSGRELLIVAGGDIAEGNLDAAVSNARAQYEKAKTDFENAEELVREQIISQKNFREIRNRFESAEIRYRTVSKNYTSKGLLVTSPMNGYIRNVYVQDGQYVEAGMPLVSLSKNRKLLLVANLSQNYYDRLSSVSSANFKIAGNDTVYNTTDLNGKKVAFGKSTENNSPFISVTFEIDNKANLVPGSVAEVFLKTQTTSEHILVPVEAVMEEQGNLYVYVQTAGESFQKRNVKAGGSDGINMQILSGIAEGERVVTRGAYQIKLASAGGTMPAHGHEH